MHDRYQTSRADAQERPLAQQLLIDVGLATTFTVAIAASAHLKIFLPFTPVPLTLQTLVVLLAGGLLGARLGFVASMGYLLLSLLGLPVMAGQSFLGPTGGYLLGFVLAAVVMGLCVRRGGWSGITLGAVLGSLIILISGSLWLSAYTGQDLGKAFQLGALPFLPGDALKTAAAIGLIRLYRRR